MMGSLLSSPRPKVGRRLTRFNAADFALFESLDASEPRLTEQVERNCAAGYDREDMELIELQAFEDDP